MAQSGEAADLILAIDVGTTAVKLAAIGLDGQLHHAHHQSYPIARPGPDRAEQDPLDWTREIDRGIADLAAQGLASRIAAIGLTSQVNTHVFLDQAGHPLIPAIVWQDGRAAAVAQALEARVPAERKIAWFGAPIPIDASHPLARMDWVRQHLPQVWAATAHVVLPKDYCILHLTGTLATDAVSNVGIANAEGFVAEALALVEGAADRMAPVRAATEVVGRVARGPLKGVPVVNGTMDGWSAIFGGAGAQEGAGVHVSGTSEILGIVSQRMIPTPGVIVFSPLAGLRLQAAPTQAGGAALAWLCSALGLTPDQVSALVGATPRKALTPLFLPQLQGERAPLWDMSLRGAFLGLDPATGPAELGWAVMEGVGFSARHALQALEASAGVRPDTLACGGGGFRSPVWTQIKADIIGRPLRPLAVNEPGLLGAAALAAMGAGLVPDLAAAHAALVRHLPPVLPDPGRRALYDDIFGLYVEAISATAPLHARLLARADAMS